MDKEKLINKWEEEIESNKRKQQLYEEGHYRFKDLEYENELISSILRDVKKLI